jgi:AmmeMemoRadiSam system protein A
MLSQTHRTILLTTAWDSIRHGLETGTALRVDAGHCEVPLSEPGASFVTLHKQGELRGCIGSLQALRPLLTDVAENAFAAAFRDPRFAPLQVRELAELTLDISVLSVPEPMNFNSEQDLLRQLRPHRDGLILQDGPQRGTFLPSVWEALPDAERFLQQLKLKAGLAPDHWSDTMRAWRYSTECFGGANGRGERASTG